MARTGGNETLPLKEGSFLETVQLWGRGKKAFMAQKKRGRRERHAFKSNPEARGKSASKYSRAVKRFRGMNNFLQGRVSQSRGGTVWRYYKNPDRKPVPISQQLVGSGRWFLQVFMRN